MNVRVSALRCLSLASLASAFLFPAYIAKSNTNDAVIPIERINLMIIPFENQTGMADSSHWGISVTELLKQQLKQFRGIFVLPDSSLKFAESTLQPSEKYSSTDARKLGLSVEAQYVVTGNYRREAESWVLTSQVWNVTSNHPPKTLVASSTEWFQVIPIIRSNILKEVQIIPSKEDAERANRKSTQSSRAFEFMSKAFASSSSGQSLTNTEFFLREAVSSDPDFGAAQQALAYVCLLQGKVYEARQIAEVAVKIRPDLSATHFTYGSILFAQELMNLARAEFREAIKCDPDETKNYVKLSEILAKKNDLHEAVSVLMTAKNNAPYDARVRAALASIYIQLKDIDKARNELKAAESISARDLGIEHLLAESYRQLGEIAKALEHYKQCLAQAKKMGLKTGLVEDVQNKIVELEMRKSVHFLAKPTIQEMSKEQATKLQNSLKPIEQKLITNPLTTSLEMDRWAEELIGDTTDNIEKARRLFEALGKRLNVCADASEKSAQDVFRDWSDNSVCLNCQDLAFLYVSLARHVGLHSYYVVVDRDYRGEIVSHACAGIVVDDKALLIDLTYGWFGVPHKDFEFQDDLRVLAFYLAHSGDPVKEDIVLKSYSDWPMLDFTIAAARLKRGERTGAKEALELGLQQDSSSWRAFLTAALIDSADSKDWHKVTANLKKCLQVYPDAPGLHYLLGAALASQGELVQARDAFRMYLRGPTEPSEASKAMQAIARINESLRNPLLPQ